MSKPTFDWLNVIDLDAAANSTQSEMYGDWIRDPWAWPELDYLKRDPAVLVDRLNSGRSRFERLSIPKINFGTRPAVVQTPVDRFIFHVLVNFVSVRVSHKVPDFVGGWRLSRSEPEPGKYLRNQQEWLGFIAARREASQQWPAVLVTDITNYFGSIPIERLMASVYQSAGKTRPVETLDRILSSFNTLADRSGIPQRSTASSLLANTYLTAVDDLLARYASELSEGRVYRWMDDIWAFGNDHDRLRRLQLDLQDELRNIGLEINLGKTAIREGVEAQELVDDTDLEREPPTRNAMASGMPYKSSHEPKDLYRQLERFLARPEMLDRTVIRYICAGILRLEDYDAAQALVSLAPKAPQGADHLSRLFARFGLWRDLEEWWIELADSQVGLRRLPWPVAQLGTMFPSAENVKPVGDYLAAAIEDSNNPPLEVLALAAHRLPKWNEADARVLLRSIGAESDSPLCRRIAGIALHNLGEEQARVSAILGEFEENSCTRAMLNARRGQPVPESADFDLASR